MGKWVILIGDQQFNLDSIKTMKFDNKTKIAEYGEKQLDVLYEDGYLSFQYDFDGMIKRDYMPEELASLPYENPQFILLRYSNLELVKHVISSVDFSKDIFIDCDGVNLGLEQVIDKLRLLNVDDAWFQDWGK